MEWIKCKDELPEDNHRRLLVTNSIDAVNAHWEMSHLWLVSTIHKSKDGEFISNEKRTNYF